MVEKELIHFMTQVTSQAELNAAIAAQESTIVVTASFNITQQNIITYPLTLSGDASGTITLTKDAAFSSEMFAVSSSGALRIQNLILDGARDTHGIGSSLITVINGTLLLDVGSVLQNNSAGVGGAVSLVGYENGENSLIVQNNAVIRNNRAQNNGGGIAVSSNVRNLIQISDNVVIENNEAQNSGGGIYVDNDFEGNFTISGNVKISNNRAINGGGVNIYRGTVEILDNVEISGNNAYSGGGIATIGRGLSIASSVVIKNNTASRRGGAVNVDSETIQLALHCSVENNVGVIVGGVIVNGIVSGSLDFTNARFINNQSTSSEPGGGAIYVYQSEGDGTLPIDLSGAIFTGNQTGNNGGGVNIESFKMVNVTANNCQFENNIANNVGGGFEIIAADHSTVLLQNSNFINNEASSGGALGFSHINADAMDITIQNVTIENNKAKTNDGGINWGSGNLKIILNNIKMIGNTAVQSGGAFSSLYGDGSITITDSEFISNQAGSEGGALNIYNARPITMENVLFSQNEANYGKDYVNEGTLQLGQSVQIQGGLLIAASEGVPIIISPLTSDSTIQLQQSYYLAPNPAGTPIVVATSALTLTPQDAALFHVPTTDDFIGWETQLSEDGHQIVVAPAVYSISYQNTLGAINPNPISFTVVSPTITLIDLESTPERRFEGWFDAADGGRLITEIPQGTSGNQTLYARWQSLQHTLTYDGNDAGGPPAEWIPYPVTVEDAQSVLLSPALPTRKGYLFTEWNTIPAGTGISYQPGDTITNVRSDITLYAQWRLLPPILHSLTYHANDAGGSAAHGIPEPEVVAEGDSVMISPIVPTRSGHRFTGWNTSPNGTGINYQPGQMIGPITGNIRLHAQWVSLTPKAWFVTFDPNTQCGNVVCGMPCMLKMTNSENAVIPNCIPCQPCYRFIGWNTSPDGCGLWYQAGQTITITTNLTLYAQWQ